MIIQLPHVLYYIIIAVIFNFFNIDSCVNQKYNPSYSPQYKLLKCLQNRIACAYISILHIEQVIFPNHL